MTLHAASSPHTEKHFTDSEAVRDIVIGMSDGLTLPFALAAGLSGAVDSSGIILLVFGYVKGLFTTGKPVRSAVQTVVVGGLAAAAAFVIAKALG